MKPILDAMTRREFAAAMIAMAAASRVPLKAAADPENEEQRASLAAFNEYYRNFTTAGTVDKPFLLSPVISRVTQESALLSLYAEAPAGFPNFRIEQIVVNINGQTIKYMDEETGKQRSWEPGNIHLPIPVQPGLNKYKIRYYTNNYYTTKAYRFYTPKNENQAFRAVFMGDTHIFDALQFIGNLEGFKGFREAVMRRSRNRDLADHVMTIDMGDSLGIGVNYSHLFHGGHFDRKSYPEKTAAALNFNLLNLMGDVPAIAPVYKIQGNHDGEEGWSKERDMAASIRKQFLPQPDDASPLENYFSVRQGNAEFFMLDVARYSGYQDGAILRMPRSPEDHRLGDEQMAWFRKALNDSTAQYKFVVAHHVLGGWPYNARGSNPGGYGRGAIADIGEQKRIHRLMKDAGVNAFIYGHDHICTVQDLDGIYYICTGKPTAIHGRRWENAEAWKMAYPTETEVIPVMWDPAYMELTVRQNGVFINFIRTFHDPEQNYGLKKPGKPLLNEDFRIA